MLPTSPDHEHSNVIIQKEKLGIRGFFYMLFGGIVAGCLSQVMAVIAVVAVIAIAASFAGESGRYQADVLTEGNEDAQVAVVPLRGEIVGQDGASSGIADAEIIVGQLKQALSDPKIKAIVIDMDTPGGGVTPSYDIYQTIHAVNKTKPVVVYINGLGASGGYYAAMGGRKIIANPTAWVGSIGVILEYPIYTGLLDKIGVQYKVYKSGPVKDIGSPLRQPTDTENTIFQGLIDDSYAQFVSVISGSRNFSVEAVRQVADGRIYTTTQALGVVVKKADGTSETVKLIDEIGNIDNAVDAAAKYAGISGPEVIRFKGPGFLSSAVGGVTHLLKSWSPTAPATKLQYIWRPGE